MTNVTGAVRVKANGQEYTLWLGFSGLAAVQEKHGQDVMERLNPPDDAPESWLPELAIVRDLFMEALQRYHAEEADCWLVDDIINQNRDVFDLLTTAAFPDQDKSKPAGHASGNGKRPRRKA